MCSNCEGQASDTFVRGIATILWGDAWASHCEEHNCVNLSGCKVEDHMPPIPEVAWRMAERLAGMIEGVNGSLAVCFAAAMRAEGKPDLEHESFHDDTALRFGECLAWRAMGAGVSWEDDHAAFMLPTYPPREMKFPHFENYELQLYAGETCKEEE